METNDSTQGRHSTSGNAATEPQNRAALRQSEVSETAGRDSRDREAPWHRHRDVLDEWEAGADLLDWKILLNPAGRGHVHLEFRDDRVVGMQSAYLRRVLVRGEPKLAAEMGNSFTDPAYRGQGVFSRCIEAVSDHCRENGIDILYGTPNSQALPAVRGKRGYTVVDNARIGYLVKILSDAELARRVHRVVPLGPTVDMGLWSWARRAAFLEWPAPNSRTSLETRVVDHVPETIDGFWGCDRSGLALFTIRDGAYLNWRYLAHPHPYLCLGSFHQNQMVGFASMRVFEEATPVHCVLVDVAAHEDAEEILVSLYREAERIAARLGAGVLSAYCSQGSPYFRLLRRRGFRRRREGIAIAVSTTTSAGRGLTLTRDPWHVMAGDTDNV
jgi:GNAT superfamily N-acetyltransferase